MNPLKKHLGACLFASLFSASLALQAAEPVSYDVVPLPQSVIYTQKGSFELKDGMTIVYQKGNKKLERNAAFMADYIKQLTGIQLNTAKGNGHNAAIYLSVGLDNPNKDAYTISVTPEGIRIQGASEAAVFYGIQTLRKSLPLEQSSAVSFPSVNIFDAPRFGYRGAMLDVGRHFFPVEFIKKYIDVLALHHINNFHWHLTEDQGWRLEVKRYPELAVKGAVREQTVIGRNTGKFDGKPYGEGCYYTQEQCKEIVKYAQERYINIIPEIDLPGHMLAALSVFPNLGCTGGPYKVGQQWGVYDDVLCAGNPETITFIQNVLREVIDIFPSHYIHVGGDECPKVRWKSCPKCQAKAKELGLVADQHHSVEHKLQSYVIKEAEKFLNKHGRDMIGWDETLEGGLAPHATVMSWRGYAGGIEAAKQRHDVIMTPTNNCYFDYYQTKKTDEAPLAIGGYLPASAVYAMEPVPAELTPEERKHIIGAQCNLWTEYVLDSDHVEYMLLPRLGAMSEVQWTEPQLKNFEAFKVRENKMIKLYKKLGYKPSPHFE